MDDESYSPPTDEELVGINIEAEQERVLYEPTDEEIEKDLVAHREWLKDNFWEEINQLLIEAEEIGLEAKIVLFSTFVERYKDIFERDDDDFSEWGYIQDIKKKLGQLYQECEKQKAAIDERGKQTESTEKEGKLLQFKYDMSLWRRLFDMKSYYNELYGQALLHVLLGAAADKFINWTAGELMTSRVHLCFIQDTGSGKNKGINFLKKVANRLIKINGEPIKIEQCSEESSASLVDRPKMKRFANGGVAVDYETIDGKKVAKKEQGKLTRNDIVYYGEASSLFNASGYADKTERIHLEMMEPDGGSYTKELISYGGESVESIGGTYSLIAVTRPISGLKKNIVDSGLLQRCLFIARKLTVEERKEMIIRAANSGMTTDEKVKFHKDFEKLVNELQSVIDSVSENNIYIHDEDFEEIQALLSRKSLDLFEQIENSESLEINKDIFTGFISRYREKSIALAFQSCIMRKGERITVKDFEYACNFLEKLFEYLQIWVEDSVTKKRDRLTDKEIERKAVVKSIISKNHGSIKLPNLVHEMMMHLKISEPTARNSLKRFGQRGFIRRTKEKSIVLNKK